MSIARITDVPILSGLSLQTFYALIGFDPQAGEVWFKHYVNLTLYAPPDVSGDTIALNHSLAKILLSGSA